MKNPIHHSSRLLRSNVDLLKSRANRSAYVGIGIATITIILATILVSTYSTGRITLSGIIIAQQSNVALWILDLMPFTFGFWGQYSSSIIAYEAGTMVFDQTIALRNRTDDLEKTANYAATHDALTDLPNQSLFLDRAEREIIHAGNHNQVTFLLIEIQNYDEINNTLGRNTCDLMIKQFSRRLHGLLNTSNTLARIDGSIFSVLLRGSTADGQQIASNILKAMESIFEVEKSPLAINANIGIVVYPEHGNDVDTLVQRAGVALNYARIEEKGYAVYNSTLDVYSSHKLTLIGELRKAIKSDELVLYYQGKVATQNYAVLGAEALVRWVHPKHGLVPPDEFIPMAERTRMIRHLTAWAVRQSFADCVRFHQMGIDIKVSVNLSARDLNDPEFPDLVAGLVIASRVRPGWMMMEITEGAIMTNPERSLEIIHKLHTQGFSLSIDDYGTGYSSLAYLKKMPLSELKIDRSFVDDMIDNNNDRVIVNATINLAHNLGLSVTAEGVENEIILKQLQGFECDLAQGYYINKPLPFDQFVEHIHNSDWLNFKTITAL
ncbi:MAG TPA: bifunctional diguanylate cyclase/phosphodiesterase [Gammaproteobacteria bacterium]|nr:bifunctional diguanylate cyclase/phosphodiesterase [Gammaproteobacteria bacterium]